MNVRFRESFARDLQRVRDKVVVERVEELIESVERCQTLNDVPNVRKLKGGAAFYRVRVGDYRAGLAVEGDIVTFVRFLHRKEVYRYFP